MLNVLVSYDITENRIRNKAARILLDYGTRIQYSVFELVEVPLSAWKQCERRLRALKLGPNDSIRMYFLCKNCAQGARVIGKGPILHVPQVYIF